MTGKLGVFLTRDRLGQEDTKYVVTIGAVAETAQRICKQRE
jgi:hypothetical protein